MSGLTAGDPTGVDRVSSCVEALSLSNELAVEVVWGELDDH